jgi:alkylhydroperoxidase family enzyme
VDINSAVGRDAGIGGAQLEDIAVFETSPHFDRCEKAVLRYAEGMTRTPAEVSDAVFEELKSFFTTSQIVELTAAIALENFRARFNCALKIESDNLCMLPPDHPVRQALKK